MIETPKGDRPEYQNDFQKKIADFLGKSPWERFRSKTPIEQLPLDFVSSDHNPEGKGNFVVGSVRLWAFFLNRWFRPEYSFSKPQILEMLEACHNDTQVIAIMKFLSGEDFPELDG